MQWKFYTRHIMAKLPFNTAAWYKMHIESLRVEVKDKMFQNDSTFGCNIVLHAKLNGYRK